MYIFLLGSFHGNGSNWNSDIPGMNRPCVSMGLLGTDQFGTANRLQLGMLLNYVSIGRSHGNGWNVPTGSV